MTILDSHGNPIKRVSTAEPITLTGDEVTTHVAVDVDPAEHQVDFWSNLLDTPEKLCGAALLAGAQREQFQLVVAAGGQPNDVLGVLGQMAVDVGALHTHMHQQAGIDPHGAVVDVGVSAEDAGHDELSHEDGAS